MKKLNITTSHCLLISGKVLEDLTEENSGITKPFFKIQAEVLPLAEEELNEKTIERLLVNRLTQSGEFLIYNKPEFVEREIHSLKNEGSDTFLIRVMSFVF